MAIAPTGDIFKNLEFDGESSKSYGVYITGEAVYNAPEKDVEMISIPGRNGSFALDKGRFDNIEVTYPAGIFATNEGDFASAISDFRNYLCSKKGYCRLTDDYNPDEYRMAVYKSGLEVSPAQLKAGEFDIKFDCMPQRYLMSGESAITVTSGDTILNPTLFDASPLLAVEGYGNVTVNNHEIELNNETVGHLVLLNAQIGAPERARFDGGLINNGDTITLNGGFSMAFLIRMNNASAEITGVTTSRTQAEISITPTISTLAVDARTYAVNVNYDSDLTFTKGSSTTKQTDKVNCAIAYEIGGVGTITNIVVSLEWTTNGTSCYIQNRLNGSSSVASIVQKAIQRGELTCESTQPVLGSPTYIDCDIGEAYKIVNNELVSLDKYIDLGSELPVLSPSNNEITFDNTITDLKIKPRWWKV